MATICSEKLDKNINNDIQDLYSQYQERFNCSFDDFFWAALDSVAVSIGIQKFDDDDGIRDTYKKIGEVIEYLSLQTIEEDKFEEAHSRGFRPEIDNRPALTEKFWKIRNLK